MSTNSERERFWRLIEEIRAERPMTPDAYRSMLGLCEERFLKDHWQLDVNFDEMAGLIKVTMRRPGQILDPIPVPCDPPFTSASELRSAIQNAEADAAVPFLSAAIMRSVLEAVFPDDCYEDEVIEMRQQWEETIMHRKRIREREAVVADAAAYGSPPLADGAL